MKNLITVIAAAMLVFHQDFWLWQNTKMVLGFIPVGLFYHVCFSIAVALLALLAIKFAWPHELERWAEGEGSPPADANPQGKTYQVR